MALYSPRQIQQSKTQRPKVDVDTLAQELVRNLQMGLPSLSPEELRRPQNPFSQPQTSETVYAPQMPPLSVPQPGGFVAGGGSGFSSDGMMSPTGTPVQPGVNQPADNLGFLPDPRGAAGDRFTQAVVALQQRIKTDKDFQYGDYDGIAKPSRKDVGMELPQLEQDTFNQVAPPSLDAALMASGIGTLLGTPGFGTRAGMNLLGGALGQSQKQDKDLYGIAMNQYEDANRVADRTYSQDVDRYGMDIRSVDARNNDITRRINNEQDALQATYGVEQRAETAEEALVARKNKDRVKAILDMMKDKTLSDADQEGLSQFLNKELGTSLSGLYSELTPYQQAQIANARLSREDRKKALESTLQNRKEMQKTFLAAVDERLKKTLANQNARDAKADTTKRDLARFKLDSDAWLAKQKMSPDAKRKTAQELADLNKNVAMAQTALNRQTTSLKDSSSRLQSARMAAAGILLKPEMIDPAYVDPKDPNMNGLNEAGRSAMKQYMKIIQDQEGKTGASLTSHMEEERRYLSAEDKYRLAVKELNDYLKNQTSEVEVPGLDITGMGKPILPGITNTDKPATAGTFKAPPSKPKSKLEAALDAAGFGKK